MVGAVRSRRHGQGYDLSPQESAVGSREIASEQVTGKMMTARNQVRGVVRVEKAVNDPGGFPSGLDGHGAMTVGWYRWLRVGGGGYFHRLPCAPSWSLYLRNNLPSRTHGGRQFLDGSPLRQERPAEPWIPQPAMTTSGLVLQCGWYMCVADAVSSGLGSLDSGAPNPHIAGMKLGGRMLTIASSFRLSSWSEVLWRTCWRRSHASP